MESWGYGVEENDNALEFKYEFQKLMRNGEHSPYCALDKLLKEDMNIEKILMAGKIEMDVFGCVKHFEEVIKAIKEALSNKELSGWVNPDDRKKELLGFWHDIECATRDSGC